MAQPGLALLWARGSLAHWPPNLSGAVLRVHPVLFLPWSQAPPGSAQKGLTEFQTHTPHRRNGVHDTHCPHGLAEGTDHPDRQEVPPSPRHPTVQEMFSE